MCIHLDESSRKERMRNNGKAQQGVFPFFLKEGQKWLQSVSRSHGTSWQAPLEYPVWISRSKEPECWLNFLHPTLRREKVQGCNYEGIKKLFLNAVVCHQNSSKCTFTWSLDSPSSSEAPGAKQI